ncbi:MAG: beta tubulin [Rhizobiales bacterium 65-9]|nr:DUF2163 domain-containing protein [Hyphomicrobiales bacterium]OJY37850.1 MAG: beta tubulin [Rhizobiales bacterium 65-9]
MRPLPPALVASIAGDATTLAKCWKATRRDGLVLGFTDHDRDIAFDGVTYAANSGVQGSDSEANADFAVGGADMSGALSSDGLSERDLAKGLWDDATIEVFIVDWSNPEARVAVDEGAIGEIRRQGAAFVAEMRGMAHRFDEERGRRFVASCSASLGDARCGVNLLAWTASAEVAGADGAALLRSAGLAGYADGLFRAGALRWTSGENAGLIQEVRDHRAEGAEAVLTLWSPPPFAIAAGDAFTVSAGCDKRFATCRDRFSNAANFRGFPHIPGSDLLMRVARQGEPNMDGGSFFR